MELINYSMNDLSDLVNKGHHLRLQNLRGGAEVLNPRSADDAFDSRACDHCIHKRAIFAMHVVADDVSPSLSKSEHQEGAQLDDGPLQYNCLHHLRGSRASTADNVPKLAHATSTVAHLPLSRLLLLFSLKLLISHLHRHQRIFTNQLNTLDHGLYWAENQPVGIIGEVQGGNTEHKADKSGGQYAIHRFLLCVRSEVEVECKVPLVVVTHVHQPREVLESLHKP
mmetsp:Transcript_31936/g.58478  ORF Transcript_31936/g.58478 Transcript_31936/m.58478 type:complete len:225 (+) Transcript_31936:969-1643(+)